MGWYGTGLQPFAYRKALPLLLGAEFFQVCRPEYQLGGNRNER